jgi:hypothetical protein
VLLLFNVIIFLSQQTFQLASAGKLAFNLQASGASGSNMSFASEGNQTAPMINNINIQIIKGKAADSVTDRFMHLKVSNSKNKDPSTHL